MTWLQRYRLRDLVLNSAWLGPILAIPAALLANQAARWADGALGWQAAVGVTGSQGVLTALASAMLTFIVFVFSIMLLAVQLASAALSPRVISLFYRSPLLRLSLSLFVFVFTFDLSVLARIDTAVPALSARIAAYGTVVAIAVFLYMIDRVGKSLRPVAVLTEVGRIGQNVIRAVYPDEAGVSAGPATDVDAALSGTPFVVPSSRSGVVLAFDPDGLLALARRSNCLVEVVPQVGDFVVKGDALFRVYAGGRDLADELLESIAIGPERTMEQDPAFAFRIIVDVASKALSPAINDPTTGVLALDQLHHLLRSVGTRNLDTGEVRDADRRLRLLYRTPDWPDFVGLAVTEIRQYGKDSIQIVRRMRAMLESLIRVLPPERALRLQEELEILHRTVERAFEDPEDRTRADLGDSLGIGGRASALNPQESGVGIQDSGR
jgi:uncharacterized membrane protein